MRGDPGTTVRMPRWRLLAERTPLRAGPAKNTAVGLTASASSVNATPTTRAPVPASITVRAAACTARRSRQLRIRRARSGSARRARPVRFGWRVCHEYVQLAGPHTAARPVPGNSCSALAQLATGPAHPGSAARHFSARRLAADPAGLLTGHPRGAHAGSHPAGRGGRIAGKPPGPGLGCGWPVCGVAWVARGGPVARARSGVASSPCRRLLFQAKEAAGGRLPDAAGGAPGSWPGIVVLSGR
jgi:hypothetical protein